MELTGKVFQILDKEKGKSARGEWSKHSFVIETKEDFPKKICIMSWNDKVDVDKLTKGDEVKVSINIESREYQGRWFTDVKAWKLEILEQGISSAKNTSAPPTDMGMPQGNFEEIPPEDATDDLPF
ncbi:MAG: DUF3127 domain-containing protein [Bacteroidales bacterium]|nr:DUF3127 domain-containing protein [Bacteroidales bacterium]